MSLTSFVTYTAFDGHRRIASGALEAVALAVKHAVENGASGPVLIFDDGTGRSLDIDTRGSSQEVLARLAAHPASTKDYGGAAPQDSSLEARDSSEVDSPENAPRGRGRPKLGVVAREVTLLPRHWSWLGAQPGGASVALRKLVDEARRTHGEQDRRRKAQERAHHFMSAMAGDMPGFEEASRALFANDQPRLRGQIEAWPTDVREHVISLAGVDGNGPDEHASTR
ncbi:MAG: DUF2239 family protein [Paraburkholderia sp.]|nr:MAG: DUF2239 family protein [Paraburkholderia sp.]